jgi:hypothetical protein
VTTSTAFCSARLIALVLIATTAASAAAQQRDTTKTRPDSATARDTAAVVDTSGPRPELRPPISPRRAFLYSLMLPGYGQSLLGRYRAGTIALAFEGLAIAMRHEMAMDLREAKRNAADSVPVSFVDADGNLVTTYQRTGFPASLIKSRRSHVEDWTAVLIANHLFAAADAYVAALLWDLPTEVAVRATPHTATVALRFDW